jgi:hypothetical protein
MTPEQRQKLETLATAAFPINDDDWGSDRQIDAENAFHIFVSDDLGVNTDDMQTAKASSEDMINEALRRAEEKHLCNELVAYCAANNLPGMSADEILAELDHEDPRHEAHRVFEEWHPWSPRTSVDQTAKA